MERLGLITKALPIKKNEKGEWVRDPRVITDRYVDNGEIVYGETKQGDELKQATAEVKKLQTDFSRLDDYVDRMIWTLCQTTLLCLMNTIESVRMRKKHYWDLEKGSQIYWLGANMNAEAFIGFNAFNTADVTGSRNIDYIEYRRQIAKITPYDEIATKVMPKPKKK